MNKSDRTPWWRKKEYWGILGVAGAVITVIPGLQIVGVAITAGVSAGLYYFGIKDGEKSGTPIGITNAVNKLFK